MIDFKFKADAEVFSDDLYYDLFDGGIDPRELLSDTAQAKSVRDAVNLLQDFLNQAQEAGVLEVG